VPKTVTRTLRVDEELDRAVAKRATSDRVSVNFLVNRCLRKFIEWDAPILELGMVVEPKLLVDRLAEDKDESQFEEYGRDVARGFLKPATLYVMGEFTVASSVELLRRSSLYSGKFRFDFVEGHDSRKQVLIIRHDQGRLWSSYFAGLLDETFKVLLGREVRIEHTDSLCIVQLAPVTQLLRT
jgi:hypothetical protein